MTDSSLPKTKKKVTLKASAQGIVKAESALVRLGFESKSNFAASQLISRSTVTKFFQGEPIQLYSLKRICTALKLSWQEIAGMSVAEEQKGSSEIELNISEETEEVGKMPTLRRQVTVVNPNSEKVKAVITIDSDVESVDSWEIIQLLLRQYSGFSINIVDIESGSILLMVEGSQEDIKKLVDKIQSGKLTELNSLLVEGVEKIIEGSKIDKNNKWELVKRIIDDPVSRRQLSNTDLSDADLRRADLSRADLSYANLSSADLSGANLSYASLSGADLSDADLSDANLSDANLFGANLFGANLSGARLFGARLFSASLWHVNLSGADLFGADLSDADLSYANLSDADLSGANVENTRFGDNQGISSSMKLDLKKRGAIFEDSPGDRSGTYALR